MLGAPEDRTSQEEEVARAKLGLPARPKVPVAHALLDKHLEGAVQFLAFRMLMGRNASWTPGPVDEDVDTPKVARDKRMYARAQADFVALSTFLKQTHCAQVEQWVARKLERAPTRIRRAHERAASAKSCKVTEVLRYAAPGPGAGRACDLITGRSLLAESPCMVVQFDADEPLYMTHETHLHIMALHVTHRLWEYVHAVIEEQWARAAEPDTEQLGQFYGRWQRWIGTPAGAGAFWKYMGATPFRQRLIQLRTCVLSTLDAVQQ